MSVNKNDVIAGQKIYSPLVLKIYNLLVIRFSNRFAWRCPSQYLITHFNSNITDEHADIGVGTGYFIDHVKFKSDKPRLALIDLNENCLQYSSRLLSRYTPKTYCADVFQPLDCVNEKFKSASINYLLHCLPGSMKDKSIVLENIAKILTKDGALFGSTILGKGVKHNFIGKYLQKIYNRKKIFCNYQDDRETLENELKKFFKDVSISVKGSVALFVAKNPN